MSFWGCRHWDPFPQHPGTLSLLEVGEGIPLGKGTLATATGTTAETGPSRKPRKTDHPPPKLPAPPRPSPVVGAGRCGLVRAPRSRRQGGPASSAHPQRDARGRGRYPKLLAQSFANQTPRGACAPCTSKAPPFGGRVPGGVGGEACSRRL